jgi:cytochrome c biogenesis protein CcmG, thiol:disulfide interchange protein DsbE
MASADAVGPVRPRGLSRRALAVAAALPLLGIAALLVMLVLRLPAAPAGASVGRVAPSFALADLNGNPVTLDALRGRPVIVNFWASWCAPCLEEFPLIRAALDRHAADGLAVIGIVYRDRSEAARDFASRMDATWTLAMDPVERVAERWGIFGPPESFFIDAGGVVRARQIGPVNEDSLSRHLAAILPEAAP